MDVHDPTRDPSNEVRWVECEAKPHAVIGLFRAISPLLEWSGIVALSAAAILFIPRCQPGPLDIPDSPPPDIRGGSFVVRHGDSLYGIARAALGDGARWREIAEMNQIIDPRCLKVGQVLRLPR